MFTWTADGLRNVYNRLLDDIALNPVQQLRNHNRDHGERVAQGIDDSHHAFWPWQFALLEFLEEFPELAFIHESVGFGLLREADRDAGDSGLFAFCDLCPSVSDVCRSERDEKVLELVPNCF